MHEVQVTQYECDHCKMRFEYGYACEVHERTCQEEQRIAREATERMERFRQGVIEQVIEAARHDVALIALVRAGTPDAALDRAEVVYNQTTGYDPGCSHWYSTVYGRMVQAVRQQECSACYGSGVVDSGGFGPQGQPIDIPCPYCQGEAK